MEKLMFFVLLSLFLFVGCEKRYKRTICVNSEVECCGVKDPLNNLEWLREASRFDDYIDNSSSDYNYIFLFIDIHLAKNRSFYLGEIKTDIFNMSLVSRCDYKEQQDHYEN